MKRIITTEIASKSISLYHNNQEDLIFSAGRINKYIRVYSCCVIQNSNRLFSENLLFINGVHRDALL